MVFAPKSTNYRKKDMEEKSSKGGREGGRSRGGLGGKGGAKGVGDPAGMDFILLVLVCLRTPDFWGRGIYLKKKKDFGSLGVEEDLEGGGCSHNLYIFGPRSRRVYLLIFLNNYYFISQANM